ncbi:CarD family transcriptional regulator [Parvularcula sp. LCG005]|uniref:CarD family transcriptional regulator n=1 Tax=Parvularcula sp. LCG005 TaxID=3078805 RepID=UPI002941CC0C|nr:CarD family transcriptional regulator [Parvularcula sp. LCG005]WOI52253.1 CarD family transcriptional regulator [Parvularcula sp. LCG005]
MKTSTKSSSSKLVPAKAAAPAPAANEDDDKPKIAPAPMRPALRVAKRAEARRDKNQTFKVNTQIVYPAHGVGHISDLEHQKIGDFEVELFVIDFDHEKMKLRVPVNKAAAAGMRNLSTDAQIDDAMEMLEGKARVKRTMWSRRAQEYEAKINSGDLVSVSEVVRDLFRADDQPEQSYSERQLFEQARERLGREVAAVRKYSLDDAVKEIHKHLDKKERAANAS